MKKNLLDQMNKANADLLGFIQRKEKNPLESDVVVEIAKKIVEKIDFIKKSKKLNEKDKIQLLSDISSLYSVINPYIIDSVSKLFKKLKY